MSRVSAVRTALWCAALALLMLGSQAALADAASAAECPNEAIRVEQDTTGLAECRAYEQVSPVDKNGFSVHWRPYIEDSLGMNFGLTAASRDGEAAAFTAWSAFSGSEVSVAQTYRSQRHADGWATSPTIPKLNRPYPAAFSDGQPQWFMATSNLSDGLLHTLDSWSPADHNLMSEEGNEVAAAGSEDLYRTTESGTVELESITPTGEAAGFIGDYAPAVIARAAPTVAFVRNGHLVPADAGADPETANVYARRGSTMTLVSQAPGGGPADPSCGSTLAELHASGPEVAGRSISNDGTRILFSTDANLLMRPQCYLPGQRQLFVRIGDTRTIPVSASQRSLPDPGAQPADANFVGASEDLSRIYFLSQAKLTDSADSADAPYLYVFSPETEKLELAGDEVGSVWDVSPDGSTVYFTRSEGSVESGYVYNLVMLKEGVERVVATAPEEIGQFRGGNWAGALDNVTSYTGDSIVFLAAQDLTSAATEHTNQAYYYEVGQPLRCLSCGDGSEPPAFAYLAAGNSSSSGFGVSERGRYASSISADGSLVAFDTPTALVKADVNNVRDIYQFNARNGTLSLVSDGRSSGGSFLLGMSASGRDILFVTQNSLLPRDRDAGGQDIYDARAGGGFPEPVLDERQCEGEGCQAPPSGAPALTTPGSSVVAGATTVAKKKPCRKAKHRAKGAKAGKHARVARCGVHKRKSKVHKRKSRSKSNQTMNTAVANGRKGEEK